MKDAKILVGELILSLSKATDHLTIAATGLKKLQKSEEVEAIQADVAKALEDVEEAVQRATSFVQNVETGEPQID